MLKRTVPLLAVLVWLALPVVASARPYAVPVPVAKRAIYKRWTGWKPPELHPACTLERRHTACTVCVEYDGTVEGGQQLYKSLACVNFSISRVGKRIHVKEGELFFRP